MCEYGFSLNPFSSYDVMRENTDQWKPAFLPILFSAMLIYFYETEFK